VASAEIFRVARRLMVFTVAPWLSLAGVTTVAY